MENKWNEKVENGRFLACAFCAFFFASSFGKFANRKLDGSPGMKVVQDREES